MMLMEMSNWGGNVVKHSKHGSGKVIFSVRLPVHSGGGGTPIPGSFPGHWLHVLSRGYSSPRFFPRSLVISGGYPSPTPSMVRMGYPPPPPGQNSRVSSGRYTSCVHAGGLSSFDLHLVHISIIDCTD